MLPLRRVSVVLAAAMAILPIVPPEHVHETTEPNGHRDLIAHRHTQAHLVEFVAAETHHGSAVDDEHNVIVTLDSVFTVPTGTYVPAAPSLPLVGALQEPAEVGRAVPPHFVERLIHGPPRAPSALRGPPASTLL